jgi:hypothetical protein
VPRQNVPVLEPAPSAAPKYRSVKLVPAEPVVEPDTSAADESAGQLDAAVQADAGHSTPSPDGDGEPVRSNRRFTAKSTHGVRIVSDVEDALIDPMVGQSGQVHGAATEHSVVDLAAVTEVTTSDGDGEAFARSDVLDPRSFDVPMMVVIDPTSEVDRARLAALARPSAIDPATLPPIEELLGREPSAADPLVLPKRADESTRGVRPIVDSRTDR